MHPPLERNISAHAFRTTQWTMVLTARDAPEPANAQALERLCSLYWYPLYSFARRKGCLPEDAKDMVQSFFVRLLERDYLNLVDRKKGKFRTFLLTTFHNFMLNEWEKSRRQKRGGGCSTISLNEIEAEERFAQEGGSRASPDLLFDKQWAEVMVDNVLARLAMEFQESGETERFTALKSSLMGDLPAEGYREVAAKLGLSESGVKTLVRRMRLRFGALLREQIAETLADAAEIESEMRHLLEALTG